VHDIVRTAGLFLFGTLSAGVAAYALVVYGSMPLGALVHPDMRTAFEAHRVAILAHIFGALVALVLGPLQFSARLRQASPSSHRWFGRMYLGVGVLIGGGAGLYMASHAFGGPVARLGFACLALVWLYSGVRAYAAIRQGRVAAHRAWMVRNVALTFAAVTLRLYLPLFLLAGIPFEQAYPAIAWLCWVPNLLAGELLVRGSRGAPARRAGPIDATIPTSR
jgi:uncharacterized membrane protein